MLAFIITASFDIKQAKHPTAKVFEFSFHRAYLFRPTSCAYGNFLNVRIKLLFSTYLKTLKTNMLSTVLRDFRFRYRPSVSLVKPYVRQVTISLGRVCNTLVGAYHTHGTYGRTVCRAASQAAYQKQWKDAASLMVVSKDNNHPKNSVFDYNILFLKRQGGSNAFGGTSVFPGGVVDDADFSPEWMQLFRKLGIETMDNFGWSHMKNKPRAGPIASPRAKGLLPNDVAFRLCAIRETFEESGILLASRWDDVRESMEKVSAKSFAPSSCYVELEENKFLKWRERIYNDAGQFLVMCQELDIFPNLWSLFELSTTLTPRAAKRRYDTIFYVSTLDSVPRVIIDEKEMANDKWLNPTEALHQHFKGDIHFLPPQILECVRCLDFPRLTDVQNYAAEVMDEGMEVCLPVGFYLKDCLIHTYPGDDYYPENVSYASIAKIPRLDETEEENLKNCKNLHRITFYDPHSLKFDCNIKLPRKNHPPRNINSKDWVDMPTM